MSYSVYQRLPPSTRRRLHQAIGEAFEAAHGGRTAEIASELAAHFERSRDVDRAVRYHGEAASRAGSRYASQETGVHLEAALDLVGPHPGTDERQWQRVALLEGLGWAQFALKGWGDEGAVRAFTQMRDLAEHAADARPSLGAVFLGLGDLAAARYHAERARDRLDPERPTVHGISSCMLLATTYAYQGRIARAQALVREAVALIPKTGTPYVRAHVTTIAAGQCQLIGDVAGARSFAEDAMRLATEWDLPVYRNLATIYRAWCDVHEGRAEQGLAALRGAFAEYAVCGQRQGTSAYAALLAEAHLANDDVIGASQALDAAFAFMAETGDRSCEHELHRLRGECLLARAENRGQTAQAAECFERAIAIAAEQQALLFELRAATSLLRLRGTAVRERVVGLVDRFAAEDECTDLHAARALLAR